MRNINIEKVWNLIERNVTMQREHKTDFKRKILIFFVVRLDRKFMIYDSHWKIEKDVLRHTDH